MFGPSLLAASLIPRAGSPNRFKHGNRWQYHSRSDHHSKVACWCLLFDLIRHCALLRKHVEDGLVGYGINHEMRDFKTTRKKNLDLVICRPRSEAPRETSRKLPKEMTFADQAEQIGVMLSPAAMSELAALPVLRRMPVGSVHVALEAKACMTAFHKARPRMYDELVASFTAIHGNSPHTIAAGLAMVNIATEFISPGRNDFDLSTQAPHVSKHRQPEDAGAAIAKLLEIPRRSREGEEGFDALAILLVDCRNDGSPVHVFEGPPAPQRGDVYNYEMTVHRLAQLYEQRFKNV